MGRPTGAERQATSGRRTGEPRLLTLLDLMALVAGIAFAFARPSPSLASPVVSHEPGVVVLARLVLWVLQVGCLGTGFAIVARRSRYGGMPRPPEWLAILISLTLVIEVVPDVDQVVEATWRPLGLGDVSFSRCRWLWAGVALAVSLVLLAAVVLGRRTLPAGMRTLLLIVAATALLWGPLPVIAQELPGLPFWYVEPPLPPADYRRFRAGLGLRAGISLIPTALLLTLPAVSTWLDYRRRGTRAWTWPEGVGSLSGALIAAAALVYFAVILGSVFLSGDLEESLRLLSWPFAAVLSFALVRRLGPAWNRWIGARYDPGHPTSPPQEG